MLKPRPVRRCRRPPLSSESAAPFSEVVADPHREARLLEIGRAADALAGRLVQALAAEDDFFEPAVEQCAPRPVEVNREAERKGFEADAVRRAAVLQAEAVDPLQPVI